jgi:hypothetical protein
MEKSEAQYAEGRLAQLKGQHKVDVLADWGESEFHSKS